jgi:hypothetical protein
MIACEKTNNETLRTEEIARNDELLTWIVCIIVMHKMFTLPIITVPHSIGATEAIILRSSLMMDSITTLSTRDITVETFWNGNLDSVDIYLGNVHTRVTIPS